MIKKKLKQLDVFGYPVNLNFNEKGDSHKTFLGSIVTIIYYLFTFAYTCLCFYRLIYHLQDLDNFVTSSVDLASLGVVNYNQTGFKMFSQIKGKMVDTSLYNLSRYLEIYYAESTLNFSVP